MKYFEFKYIEINDTEVLNQGEGVYYTSAEKNLDEIKSLVRDILKNPEAVVHIPSVTEINYKTFVQKGGNPKVR